MKKYIIVQNEMEQFDVNSKNIGTSDKLAVFYSPENGRKRYYRQSLSNPTKGLKLLTFKTEKAAQVVCDLTNNISGCNFIVELIELSKT